MEEEEDSGDRRKTGLTELRHSGEECGMRGRREKMDSGVGFYSTGGAEVARD